MIDINKSEFTCSRNLQSIRKTGKWQVETESAKDDLRVLWKVIRVAGVWTGEAQTWQIKARVQQLKETNSILTRIQLKSY